MVMKEKWILINKNNGHSITYYSNTFINLKINCNSLLNLNQDEVYEIEYWNNGDLKETVRMSDYFSLQNNTKFYEHERDNYKISLRRY